MEVRVSSFTFLHLSMSFRLFRCDNSNLYGPLISICIDIGDEKTYHDCDVYLDCNPVQHIVNVPLPLWSQFFVSLFHRHLFADDDFLKCVAIQISLDGVEGLDLLCMQG